MKNHIPLQVKCDGDQGPIAVRYHDKPLRVVARLEYWHDTGCWWAGESEKHFYRLILEDHSIREIFYDLVEEEWFLYKTYD